MLNHTSLQLSDVLPKKHLNLQRQLIWPIDHAVIWSTIQFTNWPCSDQNKDGDMGMLVILTLSWSTLRGGGGGSTSFTGRRHRKLWKKVSWCYFALFVPDFSQLQSWKEPKCRKSFDGVAFDTSVASVWKSDSQVMLVLTDVFLSENKSVCALQEICFTSTDKYT